LRVPRASVLICYEYTPLAGFYAGWPLAIVGAGDLMMLFTKKQEGFHEDHGAPKDIGASRRTRLRPAKRPNHPPCFSVKAFLLLAMESSPPDAAPPIHHLAV
jgi:hypothetical protein